MRVSLSLSPMLAFDLETTDTRPTASAQITCAAAYDPEGGIERTFVFGLGDRPEEFMQLLDSADRLCSFNGVRFDIPFMQAKWGVTAERAHAWRLKLHDVFEACRAALQVTFPLDALLDLNGLPGKTGTGAHAVVLAANAEWDELREYCLMDTKRTHAVSSLEVIRLPKLEGVWMSRRGTFHLAAGAAASGPACPR